MSARPSVSPVLGAVSDGRPVTSWCARTPRTYRQRIDSVASWVAKEYVPREAVNMRRTWPAGSRRRAAVAVSAWRHQAWNVERGTRSSRHMNTIE
jgi:hypothetical protein